MPSLIDARPLPRGDQPVWPGRLAARLTSCAMAIPRCSTPPMVRRPQRVAVFWTPVGQERVLPDVWALARLRSPLASPDPRIWSGCPTCGTWPAGAFGRKMLIARPTAAFTRHAMLSLPAEPPPVSWARLAAERDGPVRADFDAGNPRCAASIARRRSSTAACQRRWTGGCGAAIAGNACVHDLCGWSGC